MSQPCTRKINDFPSGSIQNICTEENWWAESENKIVQRGALLWAIVPHSNLVPMRLEVTGRNSSSDHGTFVGKVAPFTIRSKHIQPSIPVAALPNIENEHYIVQRAKRRPVLVLATRGDKVTKEIAEKQAKYQIAPMILAGPFYGIDKTDKRYGYQPEFVDQIRGCRYRQYFWDKLPIPGGTEESLLRFDHIHSIGDHGNSYEHTGFELSPEAMQIVDDWFFWFQTGYMVEDSDLYLARGMIQQDAS